MRLMSAAALLCLTATAAVAQYSPPGGGMPGEGMPGGRGGRGMHGGGGRGAGGPAFKPVEPIARDKLDKPVTALFRAADTNRDGLVTLAELQAIVDARREERIRERFRSIDTDRNGALSAAEFFAWQRSLGSAASSDDQSVADLGGPVSETLGPDLGDKPEDAALRRVIEPLGATMLAAANTNYDAGVSLDELLAYERARFDALDTNHDGQLTMDELRKFGPRRGGAGGGFGQRPPEERPEN